MRSNISRMSRKRGMPPGTLIHVGEKKVEEPRLSVFVYNAESFEENETGNIAECLSFRKDGHVVWINLDGLHDTSKIEELGNAFGIHPLVLEDILNTSQRPKVDIYDNNIAVFTRTLYSEGRDILETEQISLVMGDGYVITFQEQPGDIFDPVRDRIRNGKGFVRTRGADYLAYALLDAMVDSYFQVMESGDDRLEQLEALVMSHSPPDISRDILETKQRLRSIRRALWPMRDAMNALCRPGTPFISVETQPYLRDLHDHLIQVSDATDVLREGVSGVYDLYISGVSNRMNEVMKVLTIISTIFIPLTFIAGIYGMNFEHMPELSSSIAYPLVLLLMALVGTAMAAFFRRKGWL